MRKILIAAIASSVFALPAFAQLVPPTSGGAQGSAQAGTSTGGMSSSAGASATAGTSDTGTSTLGLGGLLKQTQDQTAAPPAEEGAGPMGTMDTSSHVRKKALRKERPQEHSQEH